MNFYLFSFIVIICFGPSAAARDAYIRLRKTSAGTTEETNKALNRKAGIPIVNGLVQVASQTKFWAQWLRRLLKNLRKWCNAHPPEVKLGKCIANYFNIKIPGLKRYKKNIHSNEALKEAKHSTETVNKFQKGDDVAHCLHQNGVFRETSIAIHFIFLSQHVFSKIFNRFWQYRDFVFNNDLAVCLWDYFWKKFWAWVDSAPDFSVRV